MFCAVLENKVFWPFFSFAESAMTGIVYLDMVEHVLEEEGPSYMLFQQSEVPPHLQHEVRGIIDRHFPGKWIDRGGPITWLSHSPYLTPLDFFGGVH
jgi:hypothetical protein